MDRYSFIAVDSHHLLLAGLPGAQRTILNRVYDDPTWGEVIQPQGRGASGPEPPRVWCEPKTWQEAARLAAQWPEALTAWERGFLVSLVRFPRLSDKQLALLDRVVRKACGTAGVREPADQAASTRKRPRRRRKRQN